LIKNRLINFFSKKEITAPIRNKMMMNWSNEKNFYNQRKAKEKLRVKEGRPHTVFYFHSLSDPYAHLTIQVIKKLISNFNIVLEIFFISEPSENFTPEKTMYRKHCLKDSKEIAPFYGLIFEAKEFYLKENEKLAYKILDHFSDINQDDYIDLIFKVSSLLWDNNIAGLNAIISNLSDKERELLSKKNIDINIKGNKKIQSLEYYFSASFHYEGENYWGIDRLGYLEERLVELGLKKNNSHKNIVKKLEKSKFDSNQIIKKDNSLILEFFPSLNSPYTYISFKRVERLIDNYPIKLLTKPVLPMLMRNMKIPTHKGKYILSDSAREGRKYGSIIKDIYSPIGSPANKAYSLFPIIDSYGLGFRYLEELTKASFFYGINIGNEEFLEKLSKDLGLPWDKIRVELNTDNWRSILEKNLKDMYSGNSWGVPSFKLTNFDNSNPYYQWGQDRIWLIENEIIDRLSNHQ
jgi:2-hydroxychromene-2-carboxylate isomerase